MPTTRKQNKARKSRGLEILSDIENLDIMLGENLFNARERDGSLNSKLPRRSGSLNSNESENDEGSTHRDQRVINPGTSADLDRNSITADSSAEINRLSSELNSRISREMDEMMNSVSVQIQRAINDAISNQVITPGPKCYFGRIRTCEQKRMERSGRETGNQSRSSAESECEKQSKK